MAFCPEHPKWDQNPKFIPLSETTSIPTPFIWGVPPPPGFIIGHYRVPPSLCKRNEVKYSKWFFILMHIKLIFTRKVVHLASFWKWGLLELGSGLLTSNVPQKVITWNRGQGSLRSAYFFSSKLWKSYRKSSFKPPTPSLISIRNTCEGKTTATNQWVMSQIFSRPESVKSLNFIPKFEIKTVNWSLKQEEWYKT